MKSFNFIKKLVLLLPAMMPLLVQAQTAAAESAKAPSLDMTFVLFVIACLLFLPLIYVSKVFVNLSKKDIQSKITGEHKKLSALLTLVLASQIAQAQTAVVEQPSFFSAINTQSWILLIIIFIEIILIVFFAMQVNRLLMPHYVREDYVEQVGLWEKINAFRPMSDEAKIDLGHNYDGIKELDNITPPWFTTTFIASIIFAMVYMYRYHYAHAAPLMIEEYENEMAQATKMDQSRLSGQKNQIDENTVVMMSAADIEMGKKTFAEKCAACHQAHGGSMPGGVGPNLTDDHWIHGGSLKDIFKSIKYGWPEKGMISWKDQMSANEMSQVTSFIKSIKGSNPPNAKEPQGEVYKEEAAPEAAAPAAADSTAKK